MTKPRRPSLRAAIDAKLEIDTEGRVYSVARQVPAYTDRAGEVQKWRLKPETELRTQLHGGGYFVISINGKRRYVHRLVAMAFLPNPHGHAVVHHKDGNKQNNRVENLEWTTQRENLRHALDAGLRKPYVKIKQSQLDRAKGLRDGGASIAKAARMVGVSEDHLSQLLSGRAELKYGTRTP